jgi:hypothetical protein
MKVAIYQFWDGNVRESALAGVKNMKSYAERIGADYKFENNPHWLKRDLKIDFGGYSAHFGAFKPVFNSEWDSYDKILFADTDVFTIENLEENIFDHFHGEIGICEEHFQPKQRLITAGRITSKLDEKWAKLLEKNYGVKVPRTKENLVRVFNSGVVLYSKEGRIKAQKEFEKFDNYVAMIRSSGLHSFYASDQPFLHAMMFAKKFNVQEMDSGWNSYVHGTADIYQPKRRIVDHRTEKTKFVHCQFPGADNMNEEQLLKIVNLSRDKWDYDI